MNLFLRHNMGLLIYGFVTIIFLLTLSAQAIAGNSSVYQAQKTLKELGYDPGPTDGIIGSKTISAIKQYQEKNKLPKTGQLDEATTQALGVEKFSPTKQSANPRLSSSWGMAAPPGCYWECTLSSGCDVGFGGIGSQGMKMSVDANDSHKNPGWVKKCD